MISFADRNCLVEHEQDTLAQNFGKTQSGVISEVKANFIQIPADIDMIQHTKAITTYTPDYNRPIDLFTRRFPHPASPINPSTASFLPPNLPLAAEVGLLDCPVLLQVNYQGEVEA
ncbi:hypothetical protein CVT26_012402 [Gymnopilus dilepis]|uniref:Uncharacterized protein n=1 Tax=Gymnopilus dilepis TaxID=231916 RepID=A0A409YCP6_9AGAR|nr:hypothetical protein CVT26_012402 [Gymnopilus dilepis]